MIKKINQIRYKIVKEQSKTSDKIAKIKEGKEKRWLWEFSKKLITFISISFFIAMFFAGYIMYKNYYFDALYNWIDAWKEIMIVGIFGYAVKAGVENAIKIYTSNKDKDNSDNNNNDYSAM